MPVVPVTSLAELQNHIKSGKAVAIDFYADWCGPCRMISPVFEELSNKFPSVIFIKVDVDQANEIATTYGISSLPTFLFFKNGEKVDSILGANPALLGNMLTKIA